MMDNICATTMAFCVKPEGVSEVVRFLKMEPGTTMHFNRASSSKLIVVYESVSFDDTSKFIEKGRKLGSVKSVEIIFQETLYGGEVHPHQLEQYGKVLKPVATSRL